MNFSNFFIRRPIFAGVLSSIIFIVGLLAMWRLPISEYPEVVPPTIVVRATYPGANPKTIAETVASPLEQAVNGVEESLYMFSQATGDGVMTLTVTFKLGTDIDKAQVKVQNRVAQSLPKLPEEVRRLGVTTTKQSPDLTMVVHLFSPSGREQMHHHREVGRLLGGRDAQPPNLFGQLRQRLRDAVLHLYLGLVNVRAEFESHGQRHDAVARGLREHVERILDAIDGLLQRRRDRLGDV